MIIKHFNDFEPINEGILYLELFNLMDGVEGFEPPNTSTKN